MSCGVVPGGAARDEALQKGADLMEFGDLVRGKLGYEGPPVGVIDNELLDLQLAQGLTNRGAARAELLRQGDLLELLARLVGSAEYGLANPVIDLVSNHINIRCCVRIFLQT